MRRTRKPALREEIQFATPNGWQVARVRRRETQHVYRVLYRGQYVGWLGHAEDGWRWHIIPLMCGQERSSARPYDTWQVAASHLGRTAWARRVVESSGRSVFDGIGSTVGGAPRVAEWQRHYSVRGTPWVPRAEKCSEREGEDL
ncbi:hypothetical protein [Prauserella flavalba]|uniref:hypothetical protein n=1 Tax=Prauserella flavalba TaxID=1477506 RepID=UPI0036DFFB73